MLFNLHRIGASEHVLSRWNAVLACFGPRPFPAKLRVEAEFGANWGRGYGIGATIRASEMQPLLIAISNTAAT